MSGMGWDWLVVFFLVFVGVPAVVVVLVVRSVAKTRRAKRIRERIDPGQALDAAFNGTSPVTVEVGPETLDAGTYLAGATARGYRLEAQQGNVLVFVRR